jgi:hypothetical protein
MKTPERLRIAAAFGIPLAIVALFGISVSWLYGA